MRSFAFALIHAIVNLSFKGTTFPMWIPLIVDWLRYLAGLLAAVVASICWTKRGRSYCDDLSSDAADLRRLRLLFFTSIMVAWALICLLKVSQYLVFQIPDNTIMYTQEIWNTSTRKFLENQ